MHSVEDHAAATFRQRFGADPAAIASAPGRVNLVGGHTDYNDGFVLPTGVDRRTAAAVAAREDDRLRIHSATVAETQTVVGEEPVGDWTDYVAGVRWALREAGHDVGGADVSIVSEVPVGAGLASSAALAVAACRSLDGLAGLGADGPTAAQICTRAENDFVGVPCGVLDGYAAACAPETGALELDCRSLAADPVPVDSIIMLDTGVRHDLAESAYTDRVAACERGVSLLDDLLAADVRSLRDVSVDAFERVAADLPESVRSRCRHVVTENKRVRVAAAALRAGNLERAGALMDASHRSLRDDYEVSCAELDAAAAAGRATAGVVGSRLTGAGFGGATVHLLAGNANPATVATQLAAGYRDRTGTAATTRVCRPSPGAYASSVSST
ncbi:galactokinase [Halosegnis sp.]|uniref:galactokinase n=1 Tax=Halosegnis sp. TaxID=2864959 RepID=UPI0035D469B9